MNARIMAFSSKQLYDDRLVAHASVAEHTLLQLADVAAAAADADADEPDDDNYEAHLMTPLLMIDTDGCEMHEAGARRGWS